MVASLLAMKAAMDAVLAKSFQRDEAFGNTLKEAFEQFINQRQNKCAVPDVPTIDTNVLLSGWRLLD